MNHVDSSTMFAPSCAVYGELTVSEGVVLIVNGVQQSIMAE